jgi:hypothetical protein
MSTEQSNSEESSRVTRRRFLQSLGVAGLAGASGTLLSACGGSDDSGGGSGADGGSQTQSGGGGTTTASADCSDLSALSDAQKQQRQQMANSLNYVEETPNENQYCANCQLYQSPEQEETTGSECGGCQLFPGPVTANGYCTSWAPKS